MFLGLVIQCTSYTIQISCLMSFLNIQFAAISVEVHDTCISCIVLKNTLNTRIIKAQMQELNVILQITEYGRFAEI